MRRDGRTLYHGTLEIIWGMAVGGRRGGFDGDRVLWVPPHYHPQVARRCGQAGCRVGGVAVAPGAWASAQFDAAAGTAGVWLDQRQRPAAVWPGLWAVDASGGSRTDRAKVRHP